MKHNKLIALTLALCLFAGVIAFAACKPKKPDNIGDNPIGDRVQIEFLCDNNNQQSDAITAMVKAYNDGQGLKDGVYVNPTLRTNVSTGYKNEYTKTKDYAYNVITVSDKVFRAYAISTGKNTNNGSYFLNLSPYADKDSGYEKDGIPQSIQNVFKLTYDADAEYMWAGRDQEIRGVPFATDPHVNYINKYAFEQWGINVISVPETELDDYNAEHNSQIKPHGYAEYTVAPQSGMKMSANLKGDTVCKVFNTCIGMNWEEQRYLSKCFTSEYRTLSPSQYGYDSEWWFGYGWSVGGDVMGFNGQEYDFTLADKTPNYLVTAKDGVTVNGVHYSAGEIVRYEDKVAEKDTIASKAGLRAIASQYDAITEFIRLSVSSNTSIDEGLKGYQVANPDSGDIANGLNSDVIVIGKASLSAASEIFKNDRDNKYSVCVCEQYREYVGGSVYYDGENKFENEYLKVIGQTYAEGTYTGELEEVDGTPIVGTNAVDAASFALVIPTCSDPDKYQASWDFISWMSSAEAQKVMAANTMFYTPVQTSVAFGEFLQNKKYGERNFYPCALAAQQGDVGDWGYFEDGSWVHDWSNDFNESVRFGSMTLSTFLTAHEQEGKTALNAMVIRIKGSR